MKAILHYAFAAVAISVCAEQVFGQSWRRHEPQVTGCPAGQAMQSTDPSGRTIACVPIMEESIIGQWATTGTTSCLQSSNGFNSNLAPLIPGAGTTTVSQLFADSIGITTFYAGGTGRSVGTTHAATFPSTNFGATSTTFGGTGGASVATADYNFNWSIQGDGTLLIDAPDPLVQPFTAPPSFVGTTATIDKLPPLVGYISKDRRTIVATHPSMVLETSTRRDGGGAVLGVPSPRLCARSRVMTRIN